MNNNTKQDLLCVNNGNKPTKEQVNARIACIVRRLCNMEVIYDITHDLTKKWQLCEASVRNYIRKAQSYIAESHTETATELINKHVAVREELFRNASKTRDKLNVVDSIAKLQGLDIKRLEVTTKKHSELKDEVIIDALTEDVE